MKRERIGCDHLLKPIKKEIGKRNGQQCTRCGKIFDIVPAKPVYDEDGNLI